MPRSATFFFDGGCRPNPGPIEIAVVSGGVTHHRVDVGTGDNNEAEWLALLYAVQLARDEGLAEAVFIGDSALVVEQASGRWKCRSAHLQPYLAAFRETSSGLDRVRVRWVARSRNLAGIALDRRHR